MSRYIGVMSGTSLDGIDIAIVQFNNTQINIEHTLTVPFENTLRQQLLTLINEGETQLETLGELDMALGLSYANAINQLIQTAKLSAQDIKAIGCHGQTIYHAPNNRFPFSMQIGNGYMIAEQTQIDTITDFRQRDIVLNGQGAPLVPAFHQAVFQQEGKNRVIANIGGISNITILPSNLEVAITGFDTGPGNGLQDQWFQYHHDHGLYDNNADWASTGSVHQELLTALMDEPFFSQPIPKSTGREYFNLAWLNKKLDLFPNIAAADVQRTLVEFTALSLTDAIKQYAPETEEVFICGGGIHNPILMDTIQQQLAPTLVSSTMELNICPDAVEACAFAWLAKQRVNNQTGNLPSVTGADRSAILGTLYPAQ